jgi:hypothetical protein
MWLCIAVQKYGENLSRRKRVIGKLERAKGFEPSTPTLARLCSTPELRPLWRIAKAETVAMRRG